MENQASLGRACAAALMILLWGLPAPNLLGASQPLQRVFILHSYEPNHVCGQPQHDGVVEALRSAGFKEGENVAIETYFMDTKRKNNTPELIRQEGMRALERIRAFSPDVLVTLDDNAFRTAGLALADTPVPVVFSGMNGQPEDYNQKRPFMNSRAQPGHNITGVYEKLHILDALQVHAKLFPQLQKTRIIVDRSPTGTAVLKQIRIEIGEAECPCLWDVKVVNCWEEYRQEIKEANQTDEIGAIYPVALLLKDGQGNVYTAPEIFAWTVRHSKKPEIAVNFAFTRLGLFGGAAVDFYAMGMQCGTMAARVLQGESPGNIGIEEAEKYSLAFNLDRAKALGIEIPTDVIMAAEEVICGGQSE